MRHKYNSTSSVSALSLSVAWRLAFFCVGILLLCGGFSTIAYAQVTSFNGRTGVVALLASDVTTVLSATPSALVGTSFESPSGSNLIVSSGGDGSVIKFGDPSYGIGTVATMSFSSAGSQMTVSNLLKTQFLAVSDDTYVVSGPVTPISTFKSRWSGTETGSPFYIQFATGSDTADASGVTNAPVTVAIDANYGGAGTMGGRSALRVNLVQTGVTGGDVMSTAADLRNFASSNMGGTSSIQSGYVYGTNPQVVLNPGATYLQLANALGEVDIAVVASSQPITIGGTVTSGDVLSVQLTSTSIVGSPISINYTTGASEQLSTIASGLQAAVNGNVNLISAGVSASASGSVVTINWPHTITLAISTSVSGAGTETLSSGAAVSGASSKTKAGGTIIR